VVAAKANALGDFLRARREQVQPEDVGLVGGTRRRVAGLRREELAMGRALAPSTTCDLSGDAPKIRPLRFWMRSRASAGWQSQKVSAPAGGPSLKTHSDPEVVAEGIDVLIDQLPPSIRYLTCSLACQSIGQVASVKLLARTRTSGARTATS